MAVETRWLRAVDQRRRSWMAYLAEASELLGQSLSPTASVLLSAYFVTIWGSLIVAGHGIVVELGSGLTI
jgi:hypothetical protein